MASRVTKPTEEEFREWQQFIEHTLMGSCKAIESCEDHDHLLDNEFFCELLDSIIFNCETCNWWCEISEMGADGNQHGICRDCCRDEGIDMEDD